MAPARTLAILLYVYVVSRKSESFFRSISWLCQHGQQQATVEVKYLEEKIRCNTMIAIIFWMYLADIFRDCDDKIPLLTYVRGIQMSVGAPGYDTLSGMAAQHLVSNVERAATSAKDYGKF